MEESRLESAARELAGPDIKDVEVAGIESIEAARELGGEYWGAARRQVQHGELDDRRLYWRRLAARSALVNQGQTASHLLTAFEKASRNQALSFDPTCAFRVLVTGFDPFHLDTDIRQSNPSGVLALLLDGVRQQVSGKSAEIRTMIVPVRFRDFDEGLIEQMLMHCLDDIDMLITVSMGRTDFDLERFPGRRRSSGTPDNCRLYCGGTAEHPIVPLGPDGPEFVEFSLPVTEMLTVPGDFLVNDNRTVTTLEDGEFEASNLDDLSVATAVRGSGGGYLSNEISYRAIRQVRSVGRQIPVGHIHTPEVTGFDPVRISRICDQGRRLVERAVSTLA